MCSAMQNLREAIAGYRGRLMHEGNDVKRNALLQVLHNTPAIHRGLLCACKHCAAIGCPGRRGGKRAGIFWSSTAHGSFAGHALRGC